MLAALQLFHCLKLKFFWMPFSYSAHAAPPYLTLWGNLGVRQKLVSSTGTQGLFNRHPGFHRHRWLLQNPGCSLEWPPYKGD
jgi:hypothetical protein